MCSTMVVPMPMPRPSTAAIIGTSTVASALMKSPPAERVSPPAERCTKSAMSLPEVKTPGTPAKTTARVPSAAAFSMTPRMASYMAPVRAFFLSGRFIRTSTTPWGWRSRVTWPPARAWWQSLRPSRGSSAGERNVETDHRLAAGDDGLGEAGGGGGDVLGEEGARPVASARQGPRRRWTASSAPSGASAVPPKRRPNRRVYGVAPAWASAGGVRQGRRAGASWQSRAHPPFRASAKPSGRTPPHSTWRRRRRSPASARSRRRRACRPRGRSCG